MVMFILIIECSLETNGRTDLVCFIFMPLLLKNYVSLCCMYLWLHLRTTVFWGMYFISEVWHAWKLPSLCQVEKRYFLEISPVGRALNLDLKPALNSQFSHRMPLWPLTRDSLPCCLAVKWRNLLSRMGLLGTKVNMDCDTLGNKAVNAKVNVGDEHVWRDVSFSWNATQARGFPCWSIIVTFHPLTQNWIWISTAETGTLRSQATWFSYRNHRTCLYNHTLIRGAAAKRSSQ